METKLAATTELACKNHFSQNAFYYKNLFHMVSLQWKKKFNQLRHLMKITSQICSIFELPPTFIFH